MEDKRLSDFIRQNVRKGGVICSPVAVTDADQIIQK